MQFTLRSIVLVLAGCTAGTAHSYAGPQDPRSTVDSEGKVNVPAMVVPLSNYMSDEAKQAFTNAARNARTTAPPDPESPEQRRARTDSDVQRQLTQLKALYPVNVETRQMAGLPVDIVTPQAGVPARHRDRVLINLHGGSYGSGSGGSGRLVEAIPVASDGQIKVVSVEYRLSPQYKFPDAAEDVVAVYRELLKAYRPQNIGIYGCSTGAALTAVAVVWIEKAKLPPPGAIGLLSEGAIQDDRFEGDSYFVGSALMPQGRIPGPDEPPPLNPYMMGTDPQDPLVAPVVSLDVLSRFPPTLLLTGSRDFMMSSVVYTHSRLIKAGAEAELHVWDGMWHGFYLDPSLPESKDANEVIRNFFAKRLGGRFNRP